MRRLSRKIGKLVPTHKGLLLAREPGEEDHVLRDRQLAWSLAFVAGFLNAGGFLALGFYTSHVTGTLSRLADSTVTGDHAFIVAGSAIVAAFFSGAFFTGWLVNWGRRRRFRAYFAFSLFVETGLLLLFAALGGKAAAGAQHFEAPSAFLLSFVMGMHNAVVTKISNASVRTTHMTGTVTDMGIELSRLVYWNRREGRRLTRVVANRAKLKLHSLILASFFGGGILGAFAFTRFGNRAVLPLALFLLFLCAPPLKRDFLLRARWFARLVGI